MDDVGSPSSGSVQTRYSFYNAGSDVTSSSSTNKDHHDQGDNSNGQNTMNTNTHTDATAATAATAASNTANTTDMPSNSSDGIKDILRSLKETEHLGFHKHLHGGRLHGHDEKDNILNNDEMHQFDNDFNPFSNLELEKPNDDVGKKKTDRNKDDSSSNDTQTQQKVQQIQQQVQHDSHYEKVVREALYHIRLRSQKRAALFRVSVTGSNPTNAAMPNSNSTNTIPELDSTSHTATTTSINNTKSSPSSSSPVTLMNATKLDDRLLSPPADVRKAVESSSIELFRSSNGKGTENENDNTHNHLNSNDPSVRLHLANPIHSQGCESPMQNQLGTAGEVIATAVTAATTSSTASTTSQPPFGTIPSNPAPHKFNLESSSNDATAAITRQRQIELELEKRFRREEEIEKGVEQVLLAILQSAPSSSASALASHSAVDNVFCPTDMSKNQTVDDIPRSASKSCSVVDELLAESENDEDDVSDAHHIQQPQAPELASKNNASIRPYTVEADGTLEVEAVDRGSRQSSVESDDVAGAATAAAAATTDDEHEVGGNEMVLGPLNKVSGGTTGVVLHDTESEDSEDDNNDESIDDSTDNDDTDSEEYEKEEMEMEKVKKGPQTTSATTNNIQGKAKAPMKIIESLTAAVRNNSKASELISKLSGDKKRGDDIALPRRGSLPKIKELYAHMLPYQSNKNIARKDPAFSLWFTEKLSGVFNAAPPVHPWNDEDPDELGYIIHTFSRLQLQLIEQDYDELIVKINKKFDIAVKKGMVQTSPKKSSERAIQDFAKSRNKGSPSKQRNRRPLSSKAGPRSSSTDSHLKKAEESRIGTGKRKLINDRLATNPNFPNAKPAGSGEVGDLEIYHLPIIYKAQQTGFEPTKDLILQPDTVFAGNYYVQSELGSAAFSTAYRCVDLNSGKKSDDGETYYDEVCLKVIKNTKDFFDQSLDEIKILELLRQTNQCHENNILEMKTFFYHKEHLIIVTELLRQNLFEFGKYITENNEPQYFTRDRLCYICRQCLVSLRFVHKLGLVHSDIKPENILLASYSRARVKVIDFGSSCYLTDRQSSYIQSRSYRAPEVVLGLPYSGKIDIWSLGCVIAEMYTGQVTFQNDSVVTMLARIEAICGAFPRHMIENGRQSGQFFTPTGLLYEKADFDDDSEGRLNQTPSTFDEDSSNGDNELFNVFQPKITTMAARLGFDPNIMEKKRNNWEEEEKALFVDFVTKLLTIDPDKRPTAEEALAHPWILSGYNLSEEDLKYPPEE